MKGIFLAVLAGVLFGLYNYTIKVSSNQIHEILGAVILQGVALLLGLLVLLYFKWNRITLEIEHGGLKYAIAAGIFVGLAEIVSFYVFSQGVKASTGITIIVGVTIITGVLLGVAISKESLNLQQFLGILFIVIGVVLLNWQT